MRTSLSKYLFNFSIWEQHLLLYPIILSYDDSKWMTHEKNNVCTNTLIACENELQHSEYKNIPVYKYYLARVMCSIDIIILFNR